MNAPHLPALTVRQPWAESILRGQKTVEIRKWPVSYRGSVWLHAAKTANRAAMDSFHLSEVFTGGYVGLFELEAVVRLDPTRWDQWRDQHLDAGDYQPGLFGWLIGSVIRLSEPIEAPGQLRLFWPSDPVREQLAALASELAGPNGVIFE